MKELCSFGPWMKCKINIVLLCFLKLLIILEITLCCNRDIIPTWYVRKFVLRLTHFEKQFIYSHVMDDMSFAWTNVLITQLVIQPFLQILVMKNWNRTRMWMYEQVDMICMNIQIRYSFNEDVVLWKLHVVRIPKVLVV